MPRTYSAVLHGNRVEWVDESPEVTGPVLVEVTLQEQGIPGSASERGRAMADALQTLANAGAFSAIADPVAWQREIRQDRALPRREA